MVTAQATLGTRATTQPLSFEEVIEDHGRRLYGLAYGMLKNVADAEDALQDAFLSAHRNWGSFRGDAAPGTWLHRIVVNACLMKLRKAKVRENVAYLSDTEEGAPESLVDRALGPERETVNGELRERLLDGLRSLPPNLASVVVLRDVKGYSGEETAQQLGIHLHSMKNRLHRGRLLMREFLRDYVCEPAA